MAAEGTDVNPPAPAFGQVAGLVAKPLGAVPKDARSISVSPDGSRIGMVGRKGSRWAFFVNGVAGQVYDEIVTPTYDAKEGRNPSLVTADGQHLLFVGRRGQEVFVVVDGQEGPAYDEVLTVIMAPVGGDYAVIGRHGKKFTVWQRGKEHEAFDRVLIQTAQFSPDGRRFAYMAFAEPAKGGRKTIVVIDGKASPPANWTPGILGQAGSPILFSGDSQHVAYVVAESVPRGNGFSDVTEQVVLDGKPGPKFGAIYQLQLTSDGQHVAYCGYRPPSPAERQWLEQYAARQAGAGPRGYLGRIVVDGQEKPAYGGVPFTLSESGRVATTQPKGKGVCVWIDGKESLEYDSGEGSVFSADGRRVASFVAKERLHYVLIDGEESDGYSKIDVKSFRFGADGKSHFFMAETATGKRVAVGEETAEVSLGTGDYVVSPDGKRKAFLSEVRNRRTNAESATLKIDGQVHELPGQFVTGTLTFGPDGQRLACAVYPDPNLHPGIEMVAWVDGKTMPPLARQEKISDLEFSPDGRHFAYTATVDQNPKRGQASILRQVRVIDGKPGPAAELTYEAWVQGQNGIVRGPRIFPSTFSEDGSAGYLAIHDGTLHRLDIPAATLASLPTISDLAEKARQGVAQAAKAAMAREAAEKVAAMAKEKQAKATAPFQVLHEFDGYEVGTGFIVEGKDGKLYGSTIGGRFDAGIFFVMERDGTGYKALHSFEGAEEGLIVNRLVVAPDGRLYGSARVKDGGQGGTIFSYDPAKGAYETLYLAKPGENDGWSDIVQAPLLAGVGPAGELYGLCSEYLGKAVFKLDAATRSLEVLHDASFSQMAFRREGGRTLHRLAGWGNAAGGHAPNPNSGKEFGRSLILAGGRLHSPREKGGRGGYGEIVSLALTGGDYQSAYDFAFKGAEGSKPRLLIAGPDGTLYGTTGDDGSEGKRSVFALKPGASESQVLATFDRKNNNESASALTVSGDTLYFASDVGPKIGRVPTGGGKVDELAKLENTFDEVLSLVAGSDGTLYGTTQMGGKAGKGVVFSLRPPAKP